MRDFPTSQASTLTLPRVRRREREGAERREAGEGKLWSYGKCNIRGHRCQSAATQTCDLRPQRSFSLADVQEERIMAMPTQTRESGFKTNPDYKILFESSPRRVRVKLNG